MSSVNRGQVRNLLLLALQLRQCTSLLPHLEAIELPLGHVLVEPDEPTLHVCFIESGLASVVASSNEERVEVGHIGREGMSGTHLLLGSDRTPNKTFMQVAGSGIQVAVEPLIRVLDQDAESRNLLLRYILVSELQLAHSALANARYDMQARLARWLLMCHDRLDGDQLLLTHGFLSLMLGVRRPGVTDHLHIIEGLHAIKATRGNIRVINRAKLEEIAGGCYGIPEREYERLVGIAMRRPSTNVSHIEGLLSHGRHHGVRLNFV
jgi:CRP-like cAMP-binding protein